MRLRISELTPARVTAAITRRANDVPDALRWRLSNVGEMNRRRLAKYRDLHRGARCFVIANGPSLAGMDVSPLRHEWTMSMNRAYLLYDAWGFVPSYYVCINDLVLQQFGTDIARLPTTKFVNFSSRQAVVPAPERHDLNFLRVKYTFGDRFHSDITQGIASGGTVTFACLQLAYYMGFKEVILIGLDHRFIERGVPNTTEVRQAERDESHCHPDYFPKGIKWQLPDLYRSELAYAIAREAFERDGRRILDATDGGHCQVFPKASLSAIL